MNSAHFHLAINHIPLLFPVAGILLLLLGLFTKSDLTRRNAYFIFILGAIASIGAMATGEGAEEAVEHLPGISESLIKTHEEAAEVFASLSYLVGLAALLAYISSLKNWPVAKFLPLAVLLLSLSSMYFAVRAGITGGEIRHAEIRNPSRINSPMSRETSDTKAADRHSDED